MADIFAKRENQSVKVVDFNRIADIEKQVQSRNETALLFIWLLFA